MDKTATTQQRKKSISKDKPEEDKLWNIIRQKNKQVYSVTFLT